MESLVAIIFEVVIEVGFELFFAFFDPSPPEHRRRANAIAVGLGLLTLGALLGVLTSLFFPYRMIPSAGIPGASVVLSPVITGFVMHRYGIWRKANGRTPSVIATFWGGALFALGMAAARFALV